MPSSRKHLTLDCVHLEYEIHKVTDRIFIGSTFSANNEKELQNLGITHIVNLGNQLKEYQNQYKVLWIPIRDDAETDLYSVVPITNLFISLAIQNGKVLVHCKKGRSRSPAVIMAYLIHQYHYSYQESADVFLHAKIPICLNTSFVTQLLCYAKSNGNEFAAEESFRLEHFNQILLQFNEENESAEIGNPLSSPRFEFITEERTIDITAICPFTHPYYCKQCKQLIITRNRFSVHGWDHSLDIDLCRSVMQAIGDDFPVGEQVIADDFTASNSPADERVIVDSSAENECVGNGRAFAGDSACYQACADHSPACNKPLADNSPTNQAFADHSPTNNQAYADNSPTNNQTLADPSPNPKHAVANDFPTGDQAIAEVASSDTLISFDADTRTLCQCIELSINWEKIAPSRRRRIEKAVSDYVSLCKKWRDFRGAHQNCDCCVDCCSWIRKQLRTEPGVLVCPGEGCGAIVGSFSFSSFTCSCGRPLMAKVTLDWDSIV